MKLLLLILVLIVIAMSMNTLLGWILIAAIAWGAVNYYPEKFKSGSMLTAFTGSGGKGRSIV